MSNLSKKDFDAYFGKNSLYSEDDKEKFFNRVHKVRRKRHVIPQLLTVAFVIGFLAIGITLVKDGSLFLTPGDSPSELDQVQIPNKYDQENESTVSTAIDETITFPGGTIHLHTFEMGVTKNRMYGTVELEDDIKLLNGDGTIDIGGDHPLISLYFHNEDPESNNIVIESEAFNQVPDDITITIHNIHLYGNDSYEFTIDTSELEDSDSLPRKDMSQKIAEIKDTSIFLDRVSYTDDGMQFTIVYEAKEENQQIELASYSINEYFGEESAGSPNLITARNNNGDIGKVHGGSMAEGIFSQTYYKSFAESSEYIDVTVENLLYLVRVNESVHFELEKK